MDPLIEKMRREVAEIHDKLEARERERKDKLATEALTEAVKAAGLTEPARVKVAVAALRRNVEVDDDGPAWADGQTVQQGVKRWLRSEGKWLIAEQSARPGAEGAPASSSTAPTRKQIGEALIRQLAPDALTAPVTKKEIGEALVRELGGFTL